MILKSVKQYEQKVINCLKFRAEIMVLLICHRLWRRSVLKDNTFRFVAIHLGLTQCNALLHV